MDDVEGRPQQASDAPGQPSDEEHARSVSRLGDARALRAYAHPVRMALIGLLRSEGPKTATQAAELLGESSGTCSFHLRQLAKYGLVEEAEGGTGRDKPWRAVAQRTRFPSSSDDPEIAAAGDQVNAVFAQQYFARLMRWLNNTQDEQAPWRQAAVFGDRILYVTADELSELRARIDVLLDQYLDRLVNPELRPEGARRVTYLQSAFPDEPRMP
jgi:predicted ArsR family transcriptional regulator